MIIPIWLLSWRALAFLSGKVLAINAGHRSNKTIKIRSLIQLDEEFFYCIPLQI